MQVFTFIVLIPLWPLFQPTRSGTVHRAFFHKVKILDSKKATNILSQASKLVMQLSRMRGGTATIRTIHPERPLLEHSRQIMMTVKV